MQIVQRLSRHDILNSTLENWEEVFDFTKLHLNMWFLMTLENLWYKPVDISSQDNARDLTLKVIQYQNNEKSQKSISPTY